MLNIRGKTVNSLRMSGRKTRARLSTLTWITSAYLADTRAKVLVVRDLYSTFTLGISPGKIVPLPLIEHYLYPVSTAPINSHSQEN
jgi:hypothetical protein